MTTSPMPHPRVFFQVVATLAFLAGCSASDTEPLGTAHEALFGNDKAAYDYFIGKGLTNFQAAGVVGNLDQESGVDPAIHQAGGGVGRGIAQWSTGARWDTTTNDNVLAFATQKGQSATSLGLQLDFMWYELTTFPAYGLAELKASTDITQATTVVEDKFEGCVYANYPECALPSRVNFAKGILKAYGADTGQGGAGGGGASAGGASGGGGVSGAGTAGASGAGASSGGASNAGASSGGPSNAGASPTAGAPTTAGAPSAGAPTTAGAPSIGGTPNAAGSPSTAGTSSAGGGTGGAGSPGIIGLASPTNDSSCAVSRPSMTRTRSPADNALCFAGVLLASALSFRRRRKSR
jgi:Phage tail lysozyme